MAEGVVSLESYKLNINNILVSVDIFQKEDEFVPTYSISITNISKTTNIILEKIREEFISRVAVGSITLEETTATDIIQERFKAEITNLIKKYFPSADKETIDMLVTYVIQQNLGLGNIEILLKDPYLEEIVANSSKEPVWVYHKRHGWLKTNVFIKEEDRIRHYSTMIARDVGKDITLLNPLLDAHLKTGDRVNATLKPISTYGNTLTIRKFAARPWTITDFIKENTMSLDVAAFLWLAVQHELSTLIAGGTGSGKTSTLNVIANFFPPNQRIISIEDTREITLPKSLHWVPMQTRLPNPEGKGGVTMLDLVVNSLRMRPDRIIVGEIRRQREAEVLFEAMHTGHSVYATIHANNAQETIMRLTNPPINIPKLVLPALHLILVQNRNRRTNLRRTLQLAEVTPTGDPSVFMQLDVHADLIRKIREATNVLETLNIYTGMTSEEVRRDLTHKVEVLKWIVKQNVTNIHEIGMIFAKYYAGKLS